MRLEKQPDTRIRFERYQHLNDLFQHYLEESHNATVANLVGKGIKSATEAETFSVIIKTPMFDKPNRKFLDVKRGSSY